MPTFISTAQYFLIEKVGLVALLLGLDLVVGCPFIVHILEYCITTFTYSRIVSLLRAKALRTTFARRTKVLLFGCPSSVHVLVITFLVHVLY
jgi:hypothetical protein